MLRGVFLSDLPCNARRRLWLYLRLRRRAEEKKKQLLENMRQAKAKEYAEKYGGRYETQDGADLDKQNDEGR